MERRLNYLVQWEQEPRTSGYVPNLQCLDSITIMTMTKIGLRSVVAVKRLWIQTIYGRVVVAFTSAIS
eukprot:1954180-Amphidinium_carterae.1